MKRIAAINGDEQDMFTPWKHNVADNHSRSAKIKRRFRKRERKFHNRIDLGNILEDADEYITYGNVLHRNYD